MNTLDEIDFIKTLSSYNKPVAIKDVSGEVIFMNDPAKSLSELADNKIFPTYTETLPDEIVSINKLGLVTVDKKIVFETVSGKKEEKYYHIESFPLSNKFGLVDGSIFVFNDVTASIQFILSNSENKIYDDITGLFSKRQFQDVYSKEIEKAARYSYPLSVVTFYFDNLVFLGQSFGKDKLLNLLKFYGNFLKRNFRKTDIIFRLDFNSFVAILPHTGLAAARGKFEKIEELVETTMESESKMKSIMKFGAAEFSAKKHYTKQELLLEEAKKDMGQV